MKTDRVRPVWPFICGVLAAGCEQVIGAEFGDFTTLHDAGVTTADGTSPPEAPDSSADGAGPGEDPGGSTADAGVPPFDGGGGRCTEGEVHDIANCGNCGRFLQICNDRGVWDPPFCREPPNACPPGETEQRSCEEDGTQTATCSSTCTWVVESCVHSTCVLNQVEKRACGACGTQSRTCQAADGGARWSAFSPCMEEKECAPGEVAREVCGRCGTHSRTCQTQCTWGSWDICQNEGECAPGDTQERGCLIGLLKQTRTCTERCVWGDWIGLCL